MTGGYMLATGPCIACRRVFSFNPLHVPSTRAITGEREPVCRQCMRDINERRLAMGLDTFLVLPDAYDPAPESEMP